MYLCIVNKIGAWCNGNTRVFGTLIPSSNLGVPTILTTTMVIEERTKKAIKLLLRFLKQKNLLVEYKKDLNPKNKLENIGVKCDEPITLEELIQIRLNQCRGDNEYILETLFDKTLVYRACKYGGWNIINDSWHRFFRNNKTFLK